MAVLNSNATTQTNVAILNNILTLLREHKLIVPLAYRINYTTPTIYGWGKVNDEKKALDWLLTISQIDKKRILEDGPVMGQIIDLASNAVVAATTNIN